MIDYKRKSKNKVNKRQGKKRRLKEKVKRMQKEGKEKAMR